MFHGNLFTLGCNRPINVEESKSIVRYAEISISCFQSCITGCYILFFDTKLSVPYLTYFSIKTKDKLQCECVRKQAT